MGEAVQVVMRNSCISSLSASSVGTQFNDFLKLSASQYSTDEFFSDLGKARQFHVPTHAAHESMPATKAEQHDQQLQITDRNQLLKNLRKYFLTFVDQSLTRAS
ncbi:hypothetical protein BaRGS_00020060 [Batillaria attramentaria]|uniref:Uncharacterized protein n=1 Tax=Batillaria attramentaria TaxID=370345 RepID=A0ABD0KNV6_9CAEN